MITSLQEGNLVAITKIRAAQSPMVLPGSWSEWEQGARGNLGSLPVDYELRGVLLEPIRVGGQFRLLRIWRNGVSADGIFVSTRIEAIEGSELVITQNSVYRVSLLQTSVYGKRRSGSSQS